MILVETKLTSDQLEVLLGILYQILPARELLFPPEPRIRFLELIRDLDTVWHDSSLCHDPECKFKENIKHINAEITSLQDQLKIPRA